VQDIVGLYLDPPDNALYRLMCKSQDLI
jgi:hypothetical protein